MSRTTSIAGVRPLGWLARVRAQRKCLAWACPVQLLGAAGLAPITALGMGARDDHARQRSGPGQGWCRRIPLHAPATAEPRASADELGNISCMTLLLENFVNV